MARLRINWRTMTEVAPQAVTTGDRAEDAKNTSRFADKPMMVLVAHPDPTDKMMNRLDSVVFANEQFAVGTKFFDTIRISEADASRDRVLAKAGKGAPRLVFLSREYKVAKVLSGRGISAGKGLKAMKLLSKKSYVNSFDKMVKGYIKLLNKLDQLEGTKRRLADSRSRLNSKPNASKAKKLQRDEKEYEKEVAQWNEQEKKLLEMKPKAIKQPKA
jgi:hypothetical protein